MALRRGQVRGEKRHAPHAYLVLLASALRAFRGSQQVRERVKARLIYVYLQLAQLTTMPTGEKASSQCPGEVLPRGCVARFHVLLLPVAAEVVLGIENEFLLLVFLLRRKDPKQMPLLAIPDRPRIENVNEENVNCQPPGCYLLALF